MRKKEYTASFALAILCMLILGIGFGIVWSNYYLALHLDTDCFFQIPRVIPIMLLGVAFLLAVLEVVFFYKKIKKLMKGMK